VPVEHPFLVALRPVAKALGARIVAFDEALPADIPLVFEGNNLGALRLPELTGALDRLIDQVENELGGNLEDLSREDKQRAVKMLDHRGAFVMRRSVEEVADAFGVSRITIYNYLNATRDAK
jgi:DNA invertase Pin-like site-specific DNA recombinase